MRHAHDKAIEVATELMISQISAQPYGHAEAQAEDIVRFYLAMETKLAEAFEKLPD